MLTASIPGARLDVRQLLTNPIDYPIEIRISSTADVTAEAETADNRTLLKIAAQVEDIFRSIPLAERTRNEWGDENAQTSARPSTLIAPTWRASRTWMWRTRPHRA